MYEIRRELSETSQFGSRLDWPYQLEELRNGRVIPVKEQSAMEFLRLRTVSRKIARKAVQFAGIAELEVHVPTPLQLERIKFDTLGCWNLHVYRDPTGIARYSSLDVKGLERGDGHRTMYRVFFGNDSLPNGPEDFLDHHCENKACCYPRHLERVDHAENTRRGRVRTTNDQVPFDLTNLE